MTEPYPSTGDGDLDRLLDAGTRRIGNEPEAPNSFDLDDEETAGNGEPASDPDPR